MKTYNYNMSSNSSFFFHLGFSVSNVCVEKKFESAPCQTEYLQIIATNRGKKLENSVVKRSHALASYLLQTVQLT